MGFRIATLAGNGTAGYGGDGGPVERALLNWPRDVALDAGGVLYIADTLNHRVRRIDIEGIITTVVGTSSNGYSGDGGPAISAQLAAPRGVAVAADGCLYVSDTENHCVRRIGTDGRIDTIAGTGASGSGGDGGRAADAQLSWPSVIAIGRDGSAYVADSGNHRIRRIGPEGRITAVAGTGEAGCSGDGGLAADARLSGPRGLAVSPDGGLFVADTGNHRVRKVSLDGMICTVAGTGDEGREGDGGPAASARLSAPRGLAVGPDGRLFIADCGNSLVRQVTPDGMIVTVAGNGTEGYSGDGGPAISAQLADPHGIVVSKDGTIYTAEPRSSCVRKIWCARP